VLVSQLNCPYEQSTSLFPSDLAFAPEELGLDMTVCIAARSLLSSCVIAVCDMMISFDQRIEAIDNAELKIQFLHNNWYALYAGDPSVAASIIRRIAKSLKNSNPELWDIDNFKRIIATAYQEELTEQIGDRFLTGC